MGPLFIPSLHGGMAVPLRLYLFKTLAVLGFLLALVWVPGQPSGTWTRRIIVDPGHGGYHKGGIGRIAGREVYEKQATIEVAVRLERLLKADPRFEVALTRRKDVYVGLQQRTDTASRMRGDLFVSLHCNAVPASSKSSARGFEIWTWNRQANRSVIGRAIERLENDDPGMKNRENDEILNRMMLDALESQSLESKRVARAVQSSFIAHPYFRQHDRGIDSARFKVLEVYDMPSILIEMGFMSHPEEVKMLFDPKWQERYAQLIYQGIVNYYQQYDPEFPRLPAGALLAKSGK